MSAPTPPSDQAWSGTDVQTPLRGGNTSAPGAGATAMEIEGLQATKKKPRFFNSKKQAPWMEDTPWFISVSKGILLILIALGMFLPLWNVGIGFAPPLLRSDDYDTVWPIEEAEAREMARRMAQEEGIFAGTSSGMNVTAAIRLARELGPGHVVSTVACDFGLKYMAGDLFQS